MKDRYSVYKDDVMYEITDAEYSFSDFTDDIMNDLSERQLKDTAIWRITAEQFAATSDSFGIDDSDRGWRCEYWGKLMRGGVFTYRVSRDAALYSVLEATVRHMLSLQGKDGRFSTYSPAAEFCGWDVWGRKYIMLGMIYFLDICKDDALKDEILSALTLHADYMVARLGNGSGGKLNIAKCTSHWDGLNSCSVLEPFVFLYNLTGKKEYLDFAEEVVSLGGTAHNDLFDIAYQNLTAIKDYPQRKAYEMMSCFEGLAEFVRIKNSEKHRRALKNFADRVLDEELSIIGCCGCDFECFDGTRSTQFSPTKEKDVLQETCVTVTWMKFCWQILRMFGDVRFAEALERSTYNAFCGAYLSEEESDPSENFGILLPVDSYSPLRRGTRRRKIGGRKTVTADGAFYGCCVAIYATGFGPAAFASVCSSHDGAYINLYRNGCTRIPILDEEVSFRIDTDYPSTGRISIKIGIGSPKHFALNVRIPSFAKNTLLKVNGERKEVTPGYTRIERTWESEDTLTLDFDMPIMAVYPSDLTGDTSADDCVALCRGPIVLALDERISDPSCGILLRSDERTFDAVTSKSDIPFHANASYEITQSNGDTVALVDYASAGHGKEKVNLAAWIKRG